VAEIRLRALAPLAFVAHPGVSTAPRRGTY
jgi:hypothetical protein